MSNTPPNYCAQHGIRYAAWCPNCDSDWVASINEMERALVTYRNDLSFPEAQQLIERFREMEAT